ncbi:toxin [Myceligenerans crystallogenes]|uniref:Toxin n=1 Tax=Myceligenerans crystallogenes TaxID=316335 RepID=A0ABN2NDF7_9MICO
MRLHNSARKHFSRDRLNEAAVLSAARSPAYKAPLDDEDDPRRWLWIGFDDSGRALELVVLVFDSGEELIIHAMKARRQYLDLL